MKLNIKAFSISVMIVITVPSLILFIWCSLNGFGSEVVRLFESIHPTGGFSITENFSKPVYIRLIGVLADTLYVAIESFFAGYFIALINNVLIPVSKK